MISGDLTPQRIEDATGFSMAIRFVDGPKDGAVLASYHDEHERLVNELGWENVIGSLCIDEGELVLGIFVRKNKVIEGHVVMRELSKPTPMVPSGQAALEQPM